MKDLTWISKSHIPYNNLWCLYSSTFNPWVHSNIICSWVVSNLTFNGTKFISMGSKTYWNNLKVNKITNFAPLGIFTE